MTREEIEIDKFGATFGIQFNRDQLDRLVFDKISNPKVHGGEPALFQTKWFDYRFLHPVAATYVFARAYREVFATLYKRHFDHSVTLDPFYGNLDMFELRQAEITGLYVARQHADACGIPYPYYIEFVMEAGMRYKRDYLPRPTQCYQEDAVKKAITEWHKRLEARLFVATDPRFRLDRYRGLPVQNDHIKWTMAQIARRAQPADALARYVFKDRVLPLELATARFGGKTIAKAREIAAS